MLTKRLQWKLNIGVGRQKRREMVKKNQSILYSLSFNVSNYPAPRWYISKGNPGCVRNYQMIIMRLIILTSELPSVALTQVVT